MEVTNTVIPINYSCHIAVFRDGEQLVKQHVFGLIIHGTMELNDGRKKTVFKPGEMYFARKNKMIKFIKTPPVGGEFKSLSIIFEEEMLRSFSNEYDYHADERILENAYLKFSKIRSLSAFMKTLMSYEDLVGKKGTAELFKLKQKEALILIIQLEPNLKNILFDFREPHKIDLEAFMNKNYHFNVQLDRFAYLTGRSLAAFKRDFQSVFGTSPGRWIQQKRLKQAYYLIKEKGRSASDVYIDVGFEDLSHFSYAFKKQFGKPPSKIL